MQIFNAVAIIAALAGSTSAFSSVQQKSSNRAFTALFNGPTPLGSGGMADTRDPDAMAHEDARKSISAAPSFEEYLKMRDGGAPAAPAAPAPVAAAPVAAAPASWAPPAAAAAPASWAPAAAAPAAAAPPAASAGGGDIVGTLAGLEGPGQVWGADGIAVGKEESDLKGYDNFGLFVERLQSSGVANELAGAGPFTVFAPTDTAVQSHEKMIGSFDAAACRLHIVAGNVPSASVGTADLTTLAGGKLVYKRAFRKDFVNDVIVGEKTFGQFSDFPTDVACSNGVIHTIGISCAASL